jgi:hypothetical protein
VALTWGDAYPPSQGPGRSNSKLRGSGREGLATTRDGAGRSDGDRGWGRQT